MRVRQNGRPGCRFVVFCALGTEFERMKAERVKEKKTNIIGKNNK